MNTTLEDARKFAVETAARRSVYELVSIWWHADPDKVCLVMVDESRMTWGEEPNFRMDGIDHWCELVVVSPDVWANIQSGGVILPRAWDKDTLQCLYERQGDAKKLATFKYVQQYARLAMKDGATKEEIVALVRDL